MISFVKQHLSLCADLILIVSVMFWGSTFFIIKDGLSFVDPVGMLLYRFGLASLIMALVLMVKKKPFFKDGLQGFIIGVFLWLTYVPQNIGMLYTSASNSGFITALFVAFVPLLSIFLFKNKPSVLRLFAALVSLVGLWFLTGGFENLNIGDLITLIAALAVALYVLFSERYLKNDAEPLTLLFQQFFTLTVLCLIWMLVTGAPFAITSTKTYWDILYLCLFATLFTFGSYVYVQKIMTSMRVTLIFAMEPVFAAFFAWLWGNETFVIRQIFGGALIVSAMIISELRLDFKTCKTQETPSTPLN